MDLIRLDPHQLGRDVLLGLAPIRVATACVIDVEIDLGIGHFGCSLVLNRKAPGGSASL